MPDAKENIPCKFAVVDEARLNVIIGQYDPELEAIGNKQPFEVELTGGWKQCGPLAEQIREAIRRYEVSLKEAQESQNGRKQ